MFRLFDMLGRSTAMRALDEALRTAGLHPLLVPEPVKLTLIKLSKEPTAPKDQKLAFANAAELIAYCVLGPAQLADSTSSELATLADQRFETALEDGDSLDAKLVLLALHAGLIAPEISDRIELEDLDTDET
ncbi:MAG: hypothetical protein ACXIUW_02350 [Roseinatronobacter sp.]